MSNDSDIATLKCGSGSSAAADYFELLKPRVTLLVVLTGAAGLIAADAPIPLMEAMGAIFAIALGSGAAAAFNMWYDRDIDAVMHRTASRPIPSGRVDADDALGFAVLMAAMALTLMVLSAGILSMALLAAAMLFYGGVYTMYLKRRTDQNIVIGGAAGALPPVIGWAAATGDISLAPLVLFAIIFVWTPSHFWAMSLWTYKHYACAGVPMLPVTKGVKTTRRAIALYGLALAPLGVVPALIGVAGPIYLAVSVGAGLWFATLAVRLWLSRAGDADAPGDIGKAKAVFGASILYLAALFVTLSVETVLS